MPGIGGVRTLNYLVIGAGEIELHLINFRPDADNSLNNFLGLMREDSL